MVRVRSPDKVAKEQFTVFDVVEAGNPPLQWARQATWAQLVPRRPEGPLLSSMRGGFQSLELTMAPTPPARRTPRATRAPALPMTVSTVMIAPARSTPAKMEAIAVPSGMSSK